MFNCEHNKKVTNMDYENYNPWYAEETWTYDPENDKIGKDLAEAEHYALIENLLEQGFEWIDGSTMYNPDTGRYIYGAY